MQPSSRQSRREFMQATGLVAGAACLSLPAALPAALGAFEQPSGDRNPDAVLKRLLEGNQRFMDGQTSLLTRRRPEDFAKLSEGQAPSAVIVACADSRVAPELFFDQGIGDLFVIRVAGNVVDGAGPVVKGSIEYAVAELGVRLIVVLGHSQCGAVKAAIEHIEAADALPGSIAGLVSLIQPAVHTAKGQPGDKLTNVIKANVLKCVERLKGLDPILSKPAGSGELKIVGGSYELRTGKVEIFS